MPFVAPPKAVAQGWETDARRIALGAVGGTTNVASKVIAGQRDYRTIVIPLGLIQVLRDIRVFDPRSDRFDLVKAIEYGSAPLHYIVGGSTSDSPGGRTLVVDIARAAVSRDLNAYRGFTPAQQPVAEGLAAPNFGGTIRLIGDDNGPFQGIYLGAGPYMSARTVGTIDDLIFNTLRSETDVYFPNRQTGMSNVTEGQVTLAFTGGYRGRFPGFTRGTEADGIYVGVDYHHLHGLRYENATTVLSLGTDNAGLLTLSPSGAPLFINRTDSTSGRGFAVDLGFGVIAGPWEVALGVGGIANRTNWTDTHNRTYTLGNLFGGDNRFTRTQPVPSSDVRLTLPVDTRVSLSHHSERWSAVTEYGHGFQGNTFRSGAEYRLVVVDMRVGTIYTRDQWQPTAGVGLNIVPKVGIDLAVYGTSANAEKARKMAIAASVRISR